MSPRQLPWPMAGLLITFLGLFAALSGQSPAPTVAERLGHAADARLLILHADNLGMSRSVNRATFEALERGWITSASILVPCPWFPDVVRFAREHPDADLGIHLALNSEWTPYRWGPVSQRAAVPSLLDDAGYLPLTPAEVAEKAKPAEVEVELRAQIEQARDSGIHLTHFDSHMGTVMQFPQFFSIYQKLRDDYGLPVMIPRRVGNPEFDRLLAQARPSIDQVLMLGTAVPREQWVEAYQEMLKPLPPGVYQLIVHLAYDDEEMRGATWDHPDFGAAWRQADLDLVRSPGFREFLRQEGFILIKWKDLARVQGER